MSVTASRWVALLRGVNVNGITIKSADLAALFRDLGFADVQTVLASGNVRFSSGEDAHELKERIERALSERFDYDAWIVLLLNDRLASIVDAYPFTEDADTHAYVVFGSDTTMLAELMQEPVVVDPRERVEAGDGVVYWACPKGSSTDTPFAKRVAKGRFRATTTARNLNTVRKLL